MSDESRAPEKPWARDPEVLEKMLHAALGNGDIEGVEGALTLMAFADPQRARRLFDDLKTAVHIANGGDFRVRLEPV